MSVIKSIDFSKFTGLVFSGRDRGAAMRDKFNLDDLDRKEGQVEIIISDDVFTISSSFFLAMFGDSIRHAKSREIFLNKYIFKIPDRFFPTIERSINRALNII